MGLTFFFFVVLLLAAYVAGLYNKLVRGRNAYKNAFSQIDVQMQRRFDLIPNLVETAKAYMAHEAATLEGVALARNGASRSLAKAKDDQDHVSLRGFFEEEEKFETALSQFLMVAEAYPDLKANQNMMMLMEELSSTENKMAFARQAYNDAVMDYNNLVEQVPTNLIAQNFGHTKAPLFEVKNTKVREGVKISFKLSS